MFRDVAMKDEGVVHHLLSECHLDSSGADVHLFLWTSA